MRDRMSDPSPVPADVVRARRFELVDDAGQVRAVLGNLARDGDADYWPGLVLRSTAGRDRVWLMVQHLGPELAFDAGGNSVAILEVHDPGNEGSAPGVGLTLCDADGAPVLGWHVSAGGELELRAPTP